MNDFHNGKSNLRSLSRGGTILWYRTLHQPLRHPSGDAETWCRLFPVTPLRSITGYFQHALTGSD